MSQTPDSADRPELTFVACDPPPEGLPRGEFYCTLMKDDSVRIDRADPRVLISAKVVDEAAFGMLRPEVTLSLDHAADGHVGALLKMRGVNRQVVYRLTEWIPQIRAYVGEWPE
jgi:hypothetical protein